VAFLINLQLWYLPYLTPRTRLTHELQKVDVTLRKALSIALETGVSFNLLHCNWNAVTTFDNLVHDAFHLFKGAKGGETLQPWLMFLHMPLSVLSE
jgi:hypothetical protein